MEKALNFKHGDLAGGLSITLANDLSLDDFCYDHVQDYNRDRFEAIAIRVLLGKETIITVYAIDRPRQEGENYDLGKIPVKKFKLTEVEASELFSYCESLNFTLSTGNFSIEDMEVINK